MYTKTLSTIFTLTFAVSAYADIDITNLYLTNADFDDEAHFDYRKGELGNVAQEILPVYGWTKDINVDYTITGVYEYGTGKTFNTYGRVPSEGYQNSVGGGLALSTGWTEAVKFYQTATLGKGKYRIETAFYNGSNSTSGFSELAWIDNEGNASRSTLSQLASNQWTVDNVSFSLDNETTGRIYIGLRAVEGGSANSAKVVADYVHLFLVGDNATLLGEMEKRLNETVAEAEKLYADGSGNKADKLKNAIEETVSVLHSSNDSYEAMFRQNALLENEIKAYKMANSTAQSPILFTDHITNPSFEEGLKGWTQTGLKTQTNTSFTKKSGNTYVEKWVSNGSTIGTVSLKQEIDGLPIGNYTVIAAAHCLQDGADAGGAILFAGETTADVSSAKDYILKFTHIDESLTIGFTTKDATGNWVAIDNFRLYYHNATNDELASEISRRIESAQTLLQKSMCSSHRESLNKAIEEANEWKSTADESSLTTIARNLKSATQSAKTSTEAFERLATAVEEAKTLLQNGGKMTDELKAEVKRAEAAYADERLTVSDINSATNDLNSAILIFRTANASGEVPSAKLNPLYARGATMAFFRASFSGKDIIERGFCYSVSPNASITDSRSTLSYENNGTIYMAEGLSPSTFYYFRPYAISSSYAVGYGDVVKICTLPLGEVTWQYNNGGSADENARINDAVADAVDVWNNLTSIKGLHLNVNYGAQTPTADCSYGGWMRVGPNASYQRTGTIQHEMCHAAGVGTTSTWYDNATYRAETSKGFWLGERTDKVVQFLENDASAHLKGDNTHFWPYGVNGAHEDNGTRILYYANALIMQALGEDNLPPVSGAFASPAYTFTQDDEEYYYILPSDLADKNVALLNGGQNSAPTITNCDWEMALNDHNYAWRVHFNPETQYYDLQCVGTEKSLAINSTKPMLNNKESFAIQMLGSRENVVSGDYNMKSYWLVFANGTDNPNALSVNGMSLSASKFDHRNSASSQRWILLSRKEVRLLAGDTSELSEIELSSSKLTINSMIDGLEITAHDSEFVNVYDIFGRLLRKLYMQEGTTVRLSLAKGVYLVNGAKGIVK